MIHPDTELVFVSESIGRGVRAASLIPKGTIVWARDLFDRVLSHEEILSLPLPHQVLIKRWAYRSASGLWVLCADAGRFVNHACDANIRGVGDDIQVAVRDILPGEQITCDYAECNLDSPLDCLCGASTCRGRISGRDLVRYADRWDRDVEAALAAAADVRQPLVPYVLDGRTVGAYLNGELPAPSLRSAQFCPKDRFHEDAGVHQI